MDDGIVDAARLAFEVRRYCRSHLTSFTHVALAVDQYYAVARLRERRRASVKREKSRFVFKKGSVSIKLMRQPTWSEQLDWPTSADAHQLLHDRLMSVVDDALRPAWAGRYNCTIESWHAKLIVYAYWLLVDDGAHLRTPVLCSLQGLPWRTKAANGRSGVSRAWLGSGIGGDSGEARRVKNLRLDLIARAFDELRMADHTLGDADFEPQAPRVCAIDLEDRESGTVRVVRGVDEKWLADFSQIVEAEEKSAPPHRLSTSARVQTSGDARTSVKSPEMSDYRDIPLTESAIKVAAVLCALGPDEGMTSPEIVTAVARRFRHVIESTTVRKSIYRALKPWGMKQVAGIGYHIPKSRRAELMGRIGEALDP